MASLRADLDAFGPHLDGAARCGSCGRSSPQVVDLRKWPHIPIVLRRPRDRRRRGHLGGSRRRTRSPPTSTSRLARIGDVIAMPRNGSPPADRGGQPGGRGPCAGRAGGDRADAASSKAGREGHHLDGAAQHRELAVLERHVLAAGRGGGRVWTSTARRWGRLPHLVDDLELQLLRAVRAFHPAMDVGSITARSTPSRDPRTDGDALGGAAQASSISTSRS